MDCNIQINRLLDLESRPVEVLPFAAEDLSVDLKNIISRAYVLFLKENSCQKIYFSKTHAYYKLAPFGNIARAPHAIRKIDVATFGVIIDRKLSTTKINSGTFKTAKHAWKIRVHSPFSLSVEAIALVKDIRSQKGLFSREPFETLTDLSCVECVQKITHKTSKGLYKQFHMAKLARCDAAYLRTISPKLNFSQIAGICKDIVIGIGQLHAHGLIQIDMKPLNILIYQSPENRYSAKISDLNAVQYPGEDKEGSTYDFISLIHRYQVIATARRRNLPTTEKSLESIYHEYPFLCGSFETAVQSMALALADIGITAQTYLGKGSSTQLANFWEIVKDLIGGFAPKTGASSYKNFIVALNQHLATYPAGSTIPRPTITLEEAIARFEPLTIPLPYITILSPGTIESTSPAEGFTLSDKQISYIYSLFLNSEGTDKIYFDERGAYAKQMNRTGWGAKHSLTIVDSSTLIVDFDRKKSKTSSHACSTLLSKKVWLITLDALSHIYSYPKTLIKDIDCENDIPKPWPMESLEGLKYVEECEARFTRKTSGGFFKRYHLAQPPLSNISIFLSSAPMIDPHIVFQLFKSICLSMNELHERGFVFGNLQAKKFLIYSRSGVPNSYFTKLCCSDTGVPLGSISSKITLSCLSPALRLNLHKKVLKKIPSPSPAQIEEQYYKDPSLRLCTLTREDEIASIGLLLMSAVMEIQNSLKTIPPKKLANLWQIMKNLTGGFAPKPTCTTWTAFHADISLQVAQYLTTSKPVPKPRISLTEAAQLLNEL